MKGFKRNLIWIFILLSLVATSVWGKVTAPKEFFGFEPGADRQLFTYEQLIEYLQLLEKQTDRIQLRQIGKTPLGRPMYIAFISSAENISRLDELKNINRELALNTNLKDEQLHEYVENGRVFVLGTLSMHSNEVGPSQASAKIAYELGTTTDPEILSWLKKVVYMMVPSHNPDGMDMVVKHYLKTKGTKYEGSNLPGVYHKYVGHDNNRDFVTLSQEDTRAIAAIYNLEWFPQVMVEKHQMGSTGPRYFVPPPHDPIAENVDGEIWSWIGVFGSNLMKDMTQAGLKGVSQHYLFDDYWPGSTETCIWKNVIGFLTECASVKGATPVYVDPTELRVGGKGLSEYKKSINMPVPWEGGWWRLRDIVEYERVSTLSILKTAALHAKKILYFRNNIARKEVQKGLNQPPYFYHIPGKQHDAGEFVKLVNLLMEHGVEVYRVAKNQHTPAGFIEKGDIIIPLAQPFRGFIKEVMERQKYPVRHYTPDGEIIRPYDITSWSLPLHMGVHVKAINAKVKIKHLEKIQGRYSLFTTQKMSAPFVVFPVSNNESFQIAFHVLKKRGTVFRVKKTFRKDSLLLEAGSFIIPSSQMTDEILNLITVPPVELENITGIAKQSVSLPRIALVETFFHDMDAGWARYIFDTYGIPYTVIHPRDFEKTDFSKKFDLVIFPDNDKNILMEGKWKSQNGYYIPAYPPEYTKGIGKKGFQKLLKFFLDGGKIMAWGRSTGLFIGNLIFEKSKKEKEEFQLPIRDLSQDLQKKGLYCPGSLVRIQLRDCPLTFGLEKEIGVFYRGNPVFRTTIPIFDMDRRVVASFPEENILLSGYAEKEKLLANKVAMAVVRKSKGRLILFAFNPQFRANTSVAFKLVFNGILMP
jgi:hypothetical protein